mmetsp:Transcript_2677/g.4507  ORF Transcript_2677/g.4507 Transcript_2677/m.4507 type:complete len:141 (-) Transcript_2677:490-912(-)
MDSVLELDPQEVKHIKKLFKSEEGLKALFSQYAPRLFETAFLMLLSQGAKSDNFTLLKEMEASEDDAFTLKMNVLLEVALNLSASVVKANIKGVEEFAAILQDLGIDQAESQACVETFSLHYLQRIGQINETYEEEDEES